jgi:hypothetical protein
MTVDVKPLVVAFLRILAWVQRGDIMEVSSADLRPVSWRRGVMFATDMAHSPAGPYKHLAGNGVAAFYRPDSVRPFGHLGRIDLRSGTTPEALLTLARRIDGAEQPVRPGTPEFPWARYVFDRYRKGALMAQDVSVHAHSKAEAVVKAQRFAENADLVLKAIEPPETTDPDRTMALHDLEVVFGEVFGHGPGSAPNVYEDYDHCLDLEKKMRDAIEKLRTC